jgi:SulP family sulfate permease
MSFPLTPANAAGAATMALVNLSWMLGVGTLTAAALGAEALPVAVGCAVASSVIGGLLVTLMARAPATVTSPTSSMAVIYVGLATHLSASGARSLPEVWAMLSLAVTLTGVILLLAGAVRLSGLVKYLPRPVTIGFVSGVGLLVMVSQLPSMLGWRPGAYPNPWDFLAHVRPAAVTVCMVCAWVAWSAPRLGIGPQGPLAALAVGTVLHHALAAVLGPSAVGPTLGGLEVDAALEWSWGAFLNYVGPGWLGASVLQVLPFAAVLAFQAAMNAALTAASLPAGMAPRRGVDGVLRAQGVANLICGLVGSLPVSTNAPLSLMAARHCPAPVMGALSCALVLLAAAVAAPALALLPLAGFAGVLLVSGARMIDPSVLHLLGGLLRPGLRRESAGNLLVIGCVAGFLVSGQVGVGVAVGISLELARAMWRWSSPLNLAVLSGHHEASAPADAAPRHPIVQVRGALFFGNAPRLVKTLAGLQPGKDAIVLDLSGLAYADLTAAHVLVRELDRLVASGLDVLLAGIPAHCAHVAQLWHAPAKAQRRPAFEALAPALEALRGAQAPARQPDATSV